MSSTTGIEVRHARGCASRSGGKCGCEKTYQASVWSAREQKRIRKTFPSLAAAKGWRADAYGAVRRGTMRAPSALTLREAADAWVAGAREGTIRNNSGSTYKPSAIRGYEAALRLRILPDFGGLRLSDLQRVDLQDLADRLLGAGHDPSTIRNTFMPLRAIFRRAVTRGEVAINPTTGLELPAVRGRRDRIAAPSEAEQLLTALAVEDQALWATAAYAGVRAGELQALRWSDVDLASGIVRIERAWDAKAGVFIEPKSRAGRRSIPIAAVLRDYLIEHKLRSPWNEGLVFGRAAQSPFTYWTAVTRAKRAWEQAGLPGIGLHECRHTFASLMIAAGVNAKALSTYMGHSSVTITLDRYGHLFPGNEEEAAELLDKYLSRELSRTNGKAASLTTI
jgi:integrase